MTLNNKLTLNTDVGFRSTTGPEKARDIGLIGFNRVRRASIPPRPLPRQPLHIHYLKHPYCF